MQILFIRVEIFPTGVFLKFICLTLYFGVHTWKFNSDGYSELVPELLLLLQRTIPGISWPKTT